MSAYAAVIVLFGLLVGCATPMANSADLEYKTVAAVPEEGMDTGDGFWPAFTKQIDDVLATNRAAGWRVVTVSLAYHPDLGPRVLIVMSRGD
jgi:hypothetical protein